MSAFGAKSLPYKNIVLLPLRNEHKQDALSLVCNQFVTGSVLHQAMNISVAEYETYIEGSFDQAIEEGLSIIALDCETERLAGCLIATEFAPTPADLTQLPQKFRPIKKLLLDLEHIYAQSRAIAPGQCMLVDLAIVSESARGQGVYSKLRNAAHDIGVKRQYRYVIGELSSVATQYLCVEKLGHSVKAEIAYEDFIYQGSHPFKGIKEPPGIQLAEGLLTTA